MMRLTAAGQAPSPQTRQRERGVFPVKEWRVLRTRPVRSGQPLAHRTAEIAGGPQAGDEVTLPTISAASGIGKPVA